MNQKLDEICREVHKALTGKQDVVEKGTDGNALRRAYSAG